MLPIIELARSYIGINERNGTHKVIIDIYNSHKPLARGYRMTYQDAWCATFISALAIKLNLTDIIPTECGCERQIELFKKLGEWEENDAYVPKEGDIIYYDWQDSGKGDNTGWSDHVGIVESCDGKTITVIEGNYNDSVARRCISVNARYIRGFARPRYKVTDTTKTTTSENKGTTSENNTIVNNKGVADFVERLYNVVLERKSDETGKNYWVIQALNNGGSRVAHGFFWSTEYVNRKTTNEQFVTALYNALFNRNPANEEVNYWLHNWTSREKVFEGFTKSVEWHNVCKVYGIAI